MSRPPEYENGTYDATVGYDVPSAHRDDDVARTPPTVYHPRPQAPPSYEEYTDPAAAHGWQNAYDETAQLPRVSDEGATGGGARRDRRAGGGGRRARRKAGAGRSRRVLVVAGAVGAVSAVVLIAGFSLSGSSPEGDSQGKRDRTSPTAGDPTNSTDSTDGPPAAPGSPDADPSRTRTPDTSPSPSASASDTDPGADPDADEQANPATTPPTTSAPPAPPLAETSAAPGNSGDKPGRGQGNTKGPK